MSLDKKQLIYGCMGLGGSWDSNPITKEDIKVAQGAIEIALEIGITFFDLADIYKLGKSEKVFGEVLKKTPSLREKIILQSKAAIRYHDGKLGSNIYDFSNSYLTNQVDEILRRLQTDYLDVFMLHRPDPLINPEELAATFSQLRASGKVKEFGVSNMSVSQIAQIQKYLDRPLVANQLQFSLGHTMLLDGGAQVNRNDEVKTTGVEGMLSYAQMNNMTIQAWGSLTGGKFTGNSESLESHEAELAQYIAELSEKHHVSKEAIMLAWLLRIPANVQPVIGTTNPKRIKDCAQALSVALSREDWYNLWILARGKRLP